MNLLFFDTECANCNDGDGKICSFGYTLTDQNLKVIKKADILIDPRAKFYLPKGIKLGYPTREFRRHPPFDAAYIQLKELFEGADFVLGHAIYNDARYLISECQRYKKQGFNFEFYDTQLLYMRYNGLKAQIGLDKIIQDMGGSEIVFHRSDEDAFASMLTLKQICFKEGRSAAEILNESAECMGGISGGGLKLPPMVDLPPKPSKVINALYALGSGRICLSDACAVEGVCGKKFCFENGYLQENSGQAIYILNEIKAAGGIFERRLSKADFIITANDYAAQLPKHFKCQRLTAAEILQILSISYEKSLNFEIKPFLKNLKKAQAKPV